MLNKKYLISCIGLIVLIFGGATLQSKKQVAYLKSIDEARTIIDESGAPCPSLRVLLNLFEIKHDNTLTSIVDETQKVFKRTDGKERWQIDEKFHEKRTVAWHVIENLALISEITPMESHYDYAVILGATLPTIRTRMNHLIALWNHGVRFNKLVFLGGQRPLDPQREPQDLLLNAPEFIRSDWQLTDPIPTTEIDMMRMVYEQARLPKELANVETLFINAPMQKQSDGTLRRPTTGDTVHQWLIDDPTLKDLPNPKILVISSQPHVGYQDAVMRTLLPKTFDIDTAGSAIDDKTTKFAEILDALTRWLYQEQERRKLFPS